MANIVSGTGYYGGLNLWQIAYGDVTCKSKVDSTSRANCYQTYRDSTLSGLSGPGKDQAWTVFRGLYKGVRDSKVIAYLSTNAPVAETAPTLSTRVIRFPLCQNAGQTILQFGWSGSFSSTPGGAPTVSMSDSITSIDTSRCGSYINQWKQALLQCPAIAALDSTTQQNLLTEVTDSMVSVCRRSIDVANPYGSSTVAPSAPHDGSPRSFEEAINMVLDKSSLQYFHGFVLQSLCHRIAQAVWQGTRIYQIVYYYTGYLQLRATDPTNT